MLLAAYRRALERRPLLTQMISAGVIGCCGDALSQLIIEQVPATKFDLARSGRFFVLPAFFIAPILNRWFILLERVKGGGRLLPVKKLLIDQTCFAPLFSASIIFNLRLLEGFTVSESAAKLKQDYWSIYSRSIQLANFYLVPLNSRVVFVQLAALFWNVFLSNQTQSAYRRDVSISPRE